MFPVFHGNDPPLEPVYPLETLLFLWATLGSSIARQIGKAVLDKITGDGSIDHPAPETPKPEGQKPTFERPDGVPKEWEQKPADKGEGTKYVDPNNRGNDVRLQKGNPESQFPGQREDYAKWKKDGQWLDKNGNRVSGQSQDAHIPLDEFKFDKDIFK